MRRTSGPSPISSAAEPAATLAASSARLRLGGGLDADRLLLVLAALYVGVFCVLPLGRLFLEALWPGGEVDAGLIGRVLQSRATARAFWNTLEAGLLATVLSVAIGAVMALLTGLTDLRGRTAILFLLLLPMLIPAQISAIAWLQLLSPASPILAPLGLAPAPGSPNPLYSREGIVLLLGIEHATIAFLAVRAGLAAVPRDLIEAAQAAGAGALTIVRRVVLPLLRPSLLAAAALAFVAAIGNFGIPALLGIPGRYTMLTTLIYQRLNGFGPAVLGEVAVLGFILTALAAAGLALQALAGRGHSSASSQSSGAGACFELGPWRRPVELLVWLLLAMIAILPLLALVASALVPAVGVPLGAATLTWRHFAFALGGSAAVERAFVNSFNLSILTALATVAIAIALAYLLVCRRSRLAGILNLMADAPYALPGIVLSIACILVYLKPLPGLGLSLYNTFWILLVAYLGRFLALAFRPTLAGFMALEPALEDAARVVGAGTWRRLARILVPLVLPAAAAGALLVFMSAFNELTVSALLWSTGNETLGVIVFRLYDEGNSPAAAAVATLSVLVVLALAALASLAARLGGLPRGALPWQA